MYIIIQPTTTERVLSGICYTSQWLYGSLIEAKKQVVLHEDVSMCGIDSIFKFSLEDRDIFIIDLSSYPQQDMCLQIWREYRHDYKIFFSGYKPLIESLGLPFFEHDLTAGIVNYHKHLDCFMNRPIDDYDAHVKRLDRGRPFMPIFLSVGCQRKCPYCYVGYSNFPNVQLSKEEMFRAVDYCAEMEYDIHFYDEDLFAHPEIDALIEHMIGMDVRWICLTTGVKLAEAIKRLGEKKIIDAGNILNEIGVETADPSVLKKKQELPTLLASGLNFFWLTVTFFPTETIQSKRMTGEFLRKHGYGYDEMVGRIKTNSTHGGLGQFFQPYHGTPWFEKIESMGRVYSNRPTRLYPSFVGNKFLTDIPKKAWNDDLDLRWLDLYGTQERCSELWKKCDGILTVDEITRGDLDSIVMMAQMAQLGMLE